MNFSAFSRLSLIISQHFTDLQQFLKSVSFSRPLRVGIAVALPIIAGIELGYFEIGLAIGFGAFWSSPSDVSGSFQHKKIGILVSAALVMFVTLIKGYLHFDLWVLIAATGLLTFAIAYISIYGFRASLVSFSGLMALILSFTQDSESLEGYQYALLVGLGGLWYLLLSIVWQRVNPKAETEGFLIETYSLTAEFLETRGKLVGPIEDHEKLQSKLQKLQSELTENHETLREILILSRQTSGWSNYQNKRLLIFVQLIEMLETAIANPVNYERMDELFKEHPQYIQLFQKLIFEMAYQLQMISEAGNNKHKLPKNDSINQCFEDVKSEIALLREAKHYEEYLMLQNLLEYQEKQLTKLKRIKWLLGDTNTMAMEIEDIDRKSAQRFLVPQDYSPLLLVRNLSFKSTIFKHSLRLAITVMIGYMLGSLFQFQNPHWILLTIIVIMRPGYGLTKNRAKDRIIGTLIGGAIAVGVVFWVQNPYLYGVMSLASMVIALSMIQKNYRAAATFITLGVVFIYSILQPDVLSVINFRIIDTLIGAGLSYMAILWLLPTWEFVDIKESIEKSVRANKNFLHKITEYYQTKGSVPTSYSVARKQAFLETSNLSSAFQRMTQEPKSKQIKADQIHELVVLNHTFLASLASLSIYIQHHKTTKASERFKITTEKIEHNLENVLRCLKGEKDNVAELSPGSTPLIKEQIPTLSSSEISNLVSEDKETIRDLQEAHLVWEQLKWLLSISDKMLKLADSLKQD